MGAGAVSAADVRGVCGNCEGRIRKMCEKCGEGTGQYTVCPKSATLRVSTVCVTFLTTIWSGLDGGWLVGIWPATEALSSGARTDARCARRARGLCPSNYP